MVVTTLGRAVCRKEEEQIAIFKKGPQSSSRSRDRAEEKEQEGEMDLEWGEGGDSAAAAWLASSSSYACVEVSTPKTRSLNLPQFLFSWDRLIFCEASFVRLLFAVFSTRFSILLFVALRGELLLELLDARHSDGGRRPLRNMHIRSLTVTSCESFGISNHYY